MAETRREFDIAIVGAGFSGSLAALALHQSGFRVCLIEKESHPRFAIGESSTPAADMILRAFAETYQLSWLEPFSRYGSWQENYPEITCGIKRGFSYYQHEAGSHFHSTPSHSRELLVAASTNDYQSDTQWLRSEFDAFLAGKVTDAGITCYDETTIDSCRKSRKGKWEVRTSSKGDSSELNASFIIDATGSPLFATRFFGTRSTADGFQTHSMALYSHFEQVPRWSTLIESRDIHTADYPYQPDHSALHHLLDEGWMWMLRFNNELLSAGFVFDRNPPAVDSLSSPEQAWTEIMGRYPSLNQLFRKARPAKMPGKLLLSGRLQRKLNRLCGDGWAALNPAAGFVDPLHSTGIAHTLAGLEHVVRILIETRNHPEIRMRQLKNHEEAFFKELRLIDLLVAGCYRSRHSFPLFTAWCMLYFLCTVEYEQERLQGKTPSHFLSANHPAIPALVEQSYDSLIRVLTKPEDKQGEQLFISQLRKAIEPWNRTGLLDPSKNNMYTHTAVRF